MAVTYDLIASTSLSAATTTISGISGAYKDLIIVMKSQLAAGSEEQRLRFNGDTGTNYKNGRVGSRWDGTGGTMWFNQTDNLTAIISQGTQTTGYPQTWFIHVYDYANTNRVKAFNIVSVSNRSDSNGVGNVERIIGTYNSTAAITSVSFITFGTPDSKSIGSIYGIG